MAVRSRVIVVALMLAVVPMLGALAETPIDDAGSGDDAPDQPAEALNVSPGAYVGNLTPGYDGDLDDYDTYDNDNITKDADWYRANASDSSGTIACTSAHYEPDDEPHNETRVHLRQPALDQARLNTTTTSSGVTLAMVGPDPSGALVGLTHLDPPRVTQYDLEIDVKTIDDVGGAGGLDEVPGPCFGGSAEDNEIHEWTFEADAGDYVFLSIGTETERMDELVLEAPDGTEIGSIVSGDDIAIGAEALPDTGNYTLSLEAGDTGLLTTTSSSYEIGFSLLDDPEEEEPCRPHCMS